jgi:hypothetical protein
VTSWTSVRPLNAQRRLRITKGRPKAAQLARVPLRYLVLILAHLLDGDPVLSFGRNIKFLSRYLYGFVCIGGLDGPKVFRALADDIDAPARHHIASQIRRAKSTDTLAKTTANRACIISSRRKAARRFLLTATPSRSGSSRKTLRPSNPLLRRAAARHPRATARRPAQWMRRKLFRCRKSGLLQHHARTIFLRSLARLTRGRNLILL